MSDAGATQRHYRADCPSCGAPVEFLSAQSTHAVCAYCKSTVVREGDVLKRIGKMAELIDDHGLLQLGASGQADGQGFTLVGRLQYGYPEGTWSEWHALLSDGSSAWLSEDNGAYVFSRPVQGDITLLLPAAAKRKIVENIYAKDWKLMDETEIDDCLLELLNVLAGNFLREYSRTTAGHDLSLPEVQFEPTPHEQNGEERCFFDVEGTPFEARIHLIDSNDRGG